MIKWLREFVENIKDAIYWSRTDQRMADLYARMPHAPEEWEAEQAREWAAEEAMDRFQEGLANGTIVLPDNESLKGRVRQFGLPDRDKDKRY